jgi:hypothetical protein
MHWRSSFPISFFFLNSAVLPVEFTWQVLILIFNRCASTGHGSAAVKAIICRKNCLQFSHSDMKRCENTSENSLANLLISSCGTSGNVA